MAYLRLDKKTCTGCRTCEYACALAHTGVYNPEHSRIRLYRLSCLRIEAKFCVHCREPRCVAACPRGAIAQQGGHVSVDAGLCDNCGLCRTSCDRIIFNRAIGVAMLCDNCGACVEACPEGALTLR